MHSFDGSPDMSLACVWNETFAWPDGTAIHVRAWHGGFDILQYTVGLILRERIIGGALDRRELFARHGVAADQLVRETIALCDEWHGMADLRAELLS